MPRRRGALAGAAPLGAAALGVGPVRAQVPRAAAAPDTPPPPLPRRRRLRAPDGLEVAAYEHGNPDGPAILFISGCMQAALSWNRQTRDPDLAREFHMVACDVRGHGMSGRPEGDAFHKPGKAWADEVRAVIEAFGLRRPVLVGWSYGGRVMGDYLNEQGPSALGAMNWVGATSSVADPSRFGRGTRHQGPDGSGSEDPATAIRATVAFLRDRFEVQPSATDFATMLAFNTVVLRHVRLALTGRPLDTEGRPRALTIPVLVAHGEFDKLVLPSVGRYTAETVPGAKLPSHPNAGHAPSWEDAPRFNREPAELARSAAR